MLASASVMAGAIYYALQLRHQTKVRRTDLAIRLIPSLNVSGDVLEDAMAKVATMESKDYDDFIEKYGPFPSDKPEHKALDIVWDFYDGIGFLVKESLMGFDFAWKLYGGWCIRAWEKLKPLIEGTRKQTGISGLYSGFEYLANEMKKYEQKLQQSKA